MIRLPGQDSFACQQCAVLCCAVLCCAVLCCAVLCCAVLCCAVLGPASLNIKDCINQSMPADEDRQANSFNKSHGQQVIWPCFVKRRSYMFWVETTGTLKRLKRL